MNFFLFKFLDRIEKIVYFICFDVKSRISELAQVKMNQDYNPKEKVSYDSEHAKIVNFFLDTILFLITLLRIKGEKEIVSSNQDARKPLHFLLYLKD